LFSTARPFAPFATFLSGPNRSIKRSLFNDCGFFRMLNDLGGTGLSSDRLSAPITQRWERSSLTPVLMLAPLKK
jgi:hypothetical protein